MTNAVEMLVVGINDLGVTPRFNTLDYLPVVSEYNSSKKITTVQMNPDKNNEYNITEQLIVSISNAALYDNGVKILEWYYDAEQNLFVESYTDKQINLLAALNVKECVIKAKGPLLINGKLKAKANIAIDADALCLTEPLQTDGDILLTARQGVGFLAPINAKNLAINAAYVHQDADLQLSGQFDVSAQFFKQESSVKTLINSFRLVAPQCQLRGDLTISGSCFLTARSLIWGVNQSESTIRLLDDNHIHVSTLHIHGDTQLHIGDLNKSKEGSFIVEKDLLIDKTSIVDLYNTKFTANKLDNLGEIYFHQCTTEVITVVQNGFFDAEQSLIIISKDFSQWELGVTDLKDTNFSPRTTNLYGGQFALNDCNYTGDSCVVYAGKFELNNKTEFNLNTLSLLKEVNSNISDSQVNAFQFVKSFGTTIIENSAINTDYLKTQDNNTKIKRSIIDAKTQIKLEGINELTGSYLISAFIALHGELDVHDVRLTAVSLKIASEHAKIHSLFTFSEMLALHGSQEVDKTIFSNSSLNAQMFSCENYISLQSSTIYGLIGENISHKFKRNLKLVDSKVVTTNQLITEANSELDLQGNSTLRVGLLHSQGAMKAKDATISCDSLLQEKDSIKLESSTMSIRTMLSAQASKMELKKGSIVFTPTGALGQRSELILKEGSSFIAAATLSTSLNSTVTSHESTIATGKFTALGRIELCESLLSAKELLIYNEFEAKNKSRVNVDELILVAKKARAKFSETLVSGTEIQTFGDMNVTDGVVAAKNNLSVWSTSTMTLEGKSVALADNMALRGSLDVLKKIDSDENSAVQIKVNKKLHITQNAVVKGTADLLIEADDYLHSGSMTLSRSLVARGGVLTNYGSISAPGINLGFDECISNFGTYSTDNMAVHSNLLNIGGEIYAKKTLSVAGFYGVNLGLISANNYSNTTLLSVNGGLVAPNFSGDLRYIFSLGNFISVAKIAATTLVPSYTNTINLAFMVPGIVNASYSAYNMYDQFDLNRYRSMRKHEWMPHLCQIKSIATTAWSAFDEISFSYGEVLNSGTNFSNMSDRFFDANTYTYENLKTAASNVDWKRMGMRSAGAFLGNYSENSLIDINFGLSVAPATYKKSLFSINTGVEASFLSHTIDSRYMVHSGFSGGTEATFLTQHIYNTGILDGIEQLTFKATSMDNTGELVGNHANVTIKHLSQNGELILQNGSAKIDEFIDSTTGHTKYTDMTVSGTNSDSVGNWEAERSQFNYSNRFTLQDTATATTTQVRISTHEFSLGGTLNYSDSLVVEADKATLVKGSVVVGQKTEEDELWVPKAKEVDQPIDEQSTAIEQTSIPSSETVDTSAQKEFKPKHIFQLHVKDEIVMDGKISGGDYTQIQGREDKSTESPVPDDKEGATNPKSEQLIIGNDADIDLSYGSIDVQKAVNAGTVDLAKFALDIDSLEQQKKMTLDSCTGQIVSLTDVELATTEIKDSTLGGERFKAKGELNAKNTRFDYSEEFITTERSKSVTDNVEINTKLFEHAGNISYENLLLVKANTAHLQRGSVVNGKCTAEADLFVPITPQTTEASQDSSSIDTPETEFKPNHILIINAEHQVVLNGGLSGGDYTAIQGKKDETAMPPENGVEVKANKVDELIIGDEAHIKLSHGSLDAVKVVNRGDTDLSHFSVDINKLQQENKLKLDSCVGEITEVRDEVKSNTAISHSSLKGEILHEQGTFDAQNTYFDYATEFVTENASHVTTDDVTVVTGNFEVGGFVDYQHDLTIKADSAHLKSGSVINGKKTAEDELFVTKEGTATESQESQKEFKPQNVLSIHAKKVVIDGSLQGGDYTTINGKPVEKKSDDNSDAKTEKCESVVVGASANVDLTYGSIASDKAELSANTHLTRFEVDIGTTQIKQGGHLSLDKSVFTGDVLNSSGTFTLKDSIATVSQVNLTAFARENFKDSSLTSKKLVDNSQFSYEGQAQLFTDYYEHGGRVTMTSIPANTPSTNLFYVNAKTADLHGSSIVDNAIYDIDHFAHATQFISGMGQYSRYSVNGSLQWETQDAINLSLPFNRNCDLTVKASSIAMTAKYSKNKDLSLISTKGDVSLLSDVTSKNLYVNSTGKIRTNHTLYSSGLAQFEAKGGFYNLGGVVNAQTVAIKASEIKNISAGSSAAGLSWGAAMGTSGIINGRTDTYLEATTGNIENYGGVIRSGNYTQLVAKGNVLNSCNVRSYRGTYDQITEFDGGLIAGGAGTGTNGVGLYIKADGKVISDASDFVSNGINYIEGDKGLEFGARQSTYISDKYKSKTWYGKTKKHVVTSTITRGSYVSSSVGKNILVTEHGGVKSVATCFSSPGGTQIQSRDSVALFSLKSEDRSYSSTSSFWGLSKHSSLKIHQTSTPTLFIDNGVTRITSSEGSIDARGAYFIGGGDLDLRAHGRIQFGVDLLDHKVIEKTRGLGIFVPGMGAWQAWKNGGNWEDMFTAEDATLAKINSLLHSGNTAETIANSANLGVNLYNTTNSVMRGLANDSLGAEALSRYGLGGAGGFSPSVNFTMTESTTTSKYQTQGLGGVNRGGSVYLEAGEGIDLENGVRVHAGGDMVVNAPEIIAKAAELHSSLDSKTATQSIGVSAMGQVQDVSLGYSHNSTKATNYVNAELSSDGNMTLGYQGGAMHRVVLDGARIEAGTLDARIEHLEIIDKQDITETKTESVSASISGQVSVYSGHGDSAVTAQKSGIHVVDGLNNNGHVAQIDDAYMLGGEIVTDGVNSLKIDRLVTEQVVDHKSYTGVGISFNVHDLERLSGKKATNETGEQAIAIAEVRYDHVDYEEEHTSVLHGAQGTNIEIKELVGELHTESADGSKVIKHDEVHLVVDVPVTNKDYIDTSKKNIQAGVEKIAVALGIDPLSEINPPVIDGAVLLSRRDEEEEEEEEEEVNDIPEHEKSIGEEDVSLLSPEELKVLWEDALTHMSADDQKETKELLDDIKRKDALGKDTKEDLDKLQRHIKSSLLQVYKAATEDTWTRLSKQLGSDAAKKISHILSSPDAASKLGIKTYLGTKGILISFAFNLGGKSIDNETNIFRKAAVNTAGDISFNMLLSFSGSLAGPISWAFVGLGAIDTLFYDQHEVDRLFTDGIYLLQSSQRSFNNGNKFKAFGEYLIAVDQIESARQMQGNHYLFNLPSLIGNTVNFIWDKVTGQPDVSKSVKNPSVASNRSGFFSTIDPALTIREKDTSEDRTQPEFM